MKQNILIICFINLFLTCCNGQDKKTENSTIPLPDWQTQTFDYTKQIIPKEIENSYDYEFSPVTLKKIYITKVDNQTVILAICSIENSDKTLSELTYYFINPKTNKRISKFQSVMSVRGCEFDIPAFVIKDINNDGKDDFVFLELYNDKCSDDYRLKSNFHQIDPKTVQDELGFYLKLRDDTRINGNIKKSEIPFLQKNFEIAVEEIFKNVK